MPTEWLLVLGGLALYAVFALGEAVKTKKEHLINLTISEAKEAFPAWSRIFLAIDTSLLPDAGTLHPSCMPLKPNDTENTMAHGYYALHMECPNWYGWLYLDAQNLLHLLTDCGVCGEEFDFLVQLGEKYICPDCVVTRQYEEALKAAKEWNDTQR